MEVYATGRSPIVLSAAGKLYELINELKKYKWTIIGISKLRWNDSGERSTDDGHIVYYNESADKHKHGVGFIVNSTVTNSVMGCQSFSSRIITIRMKAISFNVTIIKVYAPTSDYSNEDTDEFYEAPNDTAV